MLNKEVPFLRTGLPICVGIIAGLYFKPGIVFLVISFFAIVLGFGISLFYNKNLTNHFYGYPLTYALFLCGLLLYTHEKKSLSDLKPRQGIFLCSLSEYPEEKNNSYKITARLYAGITESREVPLTGSLLLYIKKDSLICSLRPGDFLKIRCTPNPIVRRGNPYEFDYRFYMENRGIKYFSFAGPEDILGHTLPDHRKLKHRALIIREKIIGMYKDRGISGDRLALVAAITLGQKNMLDPEQKQIFIKAGVMHIMAVSGLHAVILSMFILNMLFFMKRKYNSLRIVITVLFLWSFAFVTGLTPSVIRATLMFSFLQAGKLMKRNINNLNSVLASAVILLLIRPSVLFDAGFLLSYSAVIFIICFYRAFYLKAVFKTWIADKIWQSVVVTITAQAGTLPLTISLFNRFPTWFIFTNIIIVPLSSFLIILGCLVPLTYPIEFISQPLASLLNYLTGLTEMLTERACSLPFSTIENIGMTTIETALFFFVILFFSWFFMHRQIIPVRYPLFVLLLFLSAGTVRTISEMISSELIVYNSSISDAVAVRTGKILNLLSDTALVPPEVLKHCATTGLKLKQIKINKETLFVTAGEKKILISSSLKNNLIQKSEPDYIILTGSYPKAESHIRLTRPLNSLIMTSSDVFSSSRLQGVLKDNNIDSVHYVKKSGAFRTRL